MNNMKGLVMLASNSKLCNEFMNKNLLILIVLINEKDGLRVTDIHSIVEGNKSWISNILSKLEKSRLVRRKKTGREVYYSLSETGEIIAHHSANLLENLLLQIGIRFDNIYLIDEESMKRSTRQLKMNFRRNRVPIHHFKGQIFLNGSKYIFIGKNLKSKKYERFEINFSDIIDVQLDYDEIFKGRYGYISAKPLRISYKNHNKNKTIYLFTNWSRSLLTARNNKKWHVLLQKNLGG